MAGPTMNVLMQHLNIAIITMWITCGFPVPTP